MSTQTSLLKEADMGTELVEHRDQSIVERGMELKVDADTMAKLVDLDQFLRRQRAEEAFNVAMHACQEEMPIIVKDAQNKQTSSRYASLENVKKIAKPIYAKHGFALSFSEADSHLPNHKRTICDVRHVAGHRVEHHVDLPVDGIGPKGNPIGGMNVVQGSISSLSYGERVLTTMIFDLTIAESDRDGQRQVTPVTEEQIATLREWLVATASNEEKFLRAFDIDTISELPSDKFDTAIAMFKRKQSR